MRINFSNQRGSTLLVAIIVTGIISTMLGSYLYLLQTQNRTVAHSHSWNAALPMAEAGVEEAMTHLARNLATNLVSDGWSNTAGLFTFGRSLGEGYYQVAVTVNSNSAYAFSNITIRSTGFVKRPLDNSYVARTVLVGVNFKFKFLGVVTKQAIKLLGGLYADSYDSGDTNYSTGGLYDPAKKDDDSFIGTNSQTNNSNIGGNVKVLGTVATGPGGALASSGTSFAVGDATYSGSGIQPGHYRDDLNVQIPDASVPFTFGYPPTVGSIGGTNYVMLNGANYITSSLGGGTKLYVTKPSALYVSGTVSLDQIIILNGASLALYVAGASTSINGAILNSGGDPQDFQYYGLPSNTSITIHGTTSIVGTIYAPSADIHCNANAELFGAMVGNTFTGMGNFAFHYDENLARVGDTAGFLISSWDEL